MLLGEAEIDRDLMTAGWCRRWALPAVADSCCWAMNALLRDGADVHATSGKEKKTGKGAAI